MHPAVDGWEDLCGLTLVEIARRRGVSPFTALLELSERSRGAAVMLFSTYSGDPSDESTLEVVLSKDWCLFETDAVLRTGGFGNPAALGTFPRILGRYVRERRLFDLESALHRMTSASADRFGLTDRGRLAVGHAADVVVFDPRHIIDSTPNGAESAGRPVGIEHVYVNGVHAVDAGKAQADRCAGRVLRV